MDDAIFKALADGTRRQLLDSLRDQDGQSLSDLEGVLEMTRFGVMKHLKVLEEAHLITTRKEGRFKYHYLNAVPLQQAIDRWIEPFVAAPTARELISLKTQLEDGPMSKPDFRSQTFINCTHDALWDALTKGELVQQYHFACEVVRGKMDAEGAELSFQYPDGKVMLSNRVIAIDPKSRIEMTFSPSWSEDRTESRCVYLVEPAHQGMKLTIEHYDVPPAHEGIEEGWARFASGLKTFLETKAPVRFITGMGAIQEA